MSKNFLTPIGIFTAGGDPTSASEGNMYFNSSSNVLRVFYTSSWHSIVPNTASYGITADYFDFNTAATVSSSYGRLKWNDEDGTLDIGMKGGNVTLQVGQEQLIRVVNKTDTNLLESEYRVVKISSAQGQRPSVVLAKADSDPNSTNTVGLVTENILNNEEGYVTNSGFVREIDTTGSLQGETWSDGNILYLSGASAGYLTNIKPSAPTHTVIVGFVTYAHQNHGKIFVKVDNGYEIDELHNVLISSPTNNQSLLYNSSASVWQNNTLSSVASATISSSATIANHANTASSIAGSLVSGTVASATVATTSGHANTASSINALLLTGTTLPAAIVSSSLTGVGTLANLTVTNTISGRAASATVATHAGTASSIAGSLVTGRVASATFAASVSWFGLTGTASVSSFKVGGDFTVDTNTLFVDSANNKVGIGTIYPASALWVYGNAGIDNGSFSVNYPDGEDSNRVVINGSNGYIGRGLGADVNPSYALHIAGDAFINNGASFNSGIYVVGNGVSNFTGSLTLPNETVYFKRSTTSEGGQFTMERPSTTSLSANIAVDIFSNSFRVFENGGNNRGAFIDFTKQADTAGSEIWTTGNMFSASLNTTISATAGVYGISVSPGTRLTGCIITNRSGGAVNRVHSAQVNVALNGTTASNGFVRGYVETNGGAAVAAAGNVFLYYIAW
jgi:hypothetical protein